MLLDYPHRRIRTSNTRFAALRKKYRAFKQEFPDLKPVYYRGRERWTPLPPEWRNIEREVARRRKQTGNSS